MTETVRLIKPDRIAKNPDNPRLIFRQEELDELQKSIADQGILVPLAVYEESGRFRLLDGERRWRCALKLGLSSVPAIVQPKPQRLQNLMMMFAIHHARKDWDPLPTAIKLQQLETEFRNRQGRAPSESELAGLASMSRGEVRRLKKLLNLPEEYRDELLRELEKPRSEQSLTVDHVLEASTAAMSLRKRQIIDASTEDNLRKAIIAKFRSGVEKNTVAPRLLAKLARAVERNEVQGPVARHVVTQLISKRSYTIADAFSQSVEQVDFEHNLEQAAARLAKQLYEHSRRRYKKTPALLTELGELLKQLKAFCVG